MSYGKIEKQHIQVMNDLAHGLDDLFNGKERPKKFGFTLLVFGFDDGANPDARINYISNADRKDMLIAMKEFIANCEGRVLNTSQQQ